MYHAALCLLDDSHLNAAILIREDDVRLQHLVIISVVSVGTNARTAHLVVALPLVQAPEVERSLSSGRTGIRAAAKAEELIALVQVKSHEADDGIVLVSLQEDVVLRGTLYGQVAQQICRGILQAAVAVTVGREAGRQLQAA